VPSRTVPICYAYLSLPVNPTAYRKHHSNREPPNGILVGKSTIQKRTAIVKKIEIVKNGTAIVKKRIEIVKKIAMKKTAAMKKKIAMKKIAAMKKNYLSMKDQKKVSDYLEQPFKWIDTTMKVENHMWN